MEYKIKTGKKIIAEFLNKSDRDLCIDALREAYRDCEFEEVDGWKVGSARQKFYEELTSKGNER